MIDRSTTTDMIPGVSESNLAESRGTNQKRRGAKSKYGKHMFNSRRNISKSEPQGRNQMEDSAGTKGQAEAKSFSSLGPNGQTARAGRRRSSAPNEAISAGPAGPQHSDATGRKRGPEPPSSARDIKPRQNDEATADVGGGLTAPANSPAAGAKA